MATAIRAIQDGGNFPVDRHLSRNTEHRPAITSPSAPAPFQRQQHQTQRLRSFAERAGDVSSDNPLSTLSYAPPAASYISDANLNSIQHSLFLPPSSIKSAKSWSLSDAFTETKLPAPLKLPTTASSTASSIAITELQSAQQRPKDPLKNRVTNTVTPQARKLWNPSNSTPRNLEITTDRSQLRVKTRDNEVVHSRDVSGESPLLSLQERNQSRLSISTTGFTTSSLRVEVSRPTTPKVRAPPAVAVRRPFEARTSLDLPSSQIVNVRTNTESHQRQISSNTVTSAPIHLHTSTPSTIVSNRKLTPHPNFQPPTIGPSFRDRMADLEAAVYTQPPTTAQSMTTSSTPRGSIYSQNPSAHSEIWGPRHPCYPHLNPHVPKSSPLYHSTRIIRIPRDWLIVGDLAPTFSLLYPSILSDSGLSETSFRALIAHLNAELQHIYSPWQWQNWVDATLGLLTGWIWDDLGITSVKRKCRKLEGWIERWNSTLQDEGGVARVVSLKRTGYLSLDIQILRPWIGEAEEGSVLRDERGS